MHSQFETSFAKIDAGGLQATSGVGPAAAVVGSNSFLTEVPPLQQCYRCWFAVWFLHISIFSDLGLNIKKPVNKLFNFCFSCCCGTGQSVLVSLCYWCCMLCCFHSGLLCREDAWSGMCHIRCVRMPIGYRPPTGAIPANQLSASWPFFWRPDPDGRWSLWLVAVSTGTAGWGGKGGGGEKGPSWRVRDFLGQSLLFPSSFLLSTHLQLESWQALLATIHCVSHAETNSPLLLQSQ